MCFVQKQSVTADNAEEVVSQVTNIVSNLDEVDEQSEANLDLIVNVYDNIVGNLIDKDSNFSVSTNVSLCKSES